MKNCITVFLLLTALTLNGQMVIREADSLKKHYTAKANELLVGDSSLYDFFSIDLYGISVFASREDKIKGLPETRVFWNELPIYKRVLKRELRENAIEALLQKGARPFGSSVQKRYSDAFTADEKTFRTPLKPLAGYRIALDPGHIAHDTLTGKLEQKFISMNLPSGKDSLHVAFAEGQLTWQTAVLLAARLRNAGAEVILTRNGQNLTAFGKTFEEWKRDDYPRTLDSLLKADPKNQSYLDLKSGKMKEDRSRFRFVFRDVEFRRRADIINAFQPDLSVMIHYNVDESNAPWTHATEKNFCMLFVPGAFQSGELSDAEKRFDFLRLLLLDDIEVSIAASEYVGAEFTKRLSVPLADASSAGYLSSSCKKTGRKGVFARNLSMTRLVHGPVLFGETLYQDNINEALSLSQMNVTDRISGQLTSKRVIQIADAYYEGILQWSYSR